MKQGLACHAAKRQTTAKSSKIDQHAVATSQKASNKGTTSHRKLAIRQGLYGKPVTRRGFREKQAQRHGQMSYPMAYTKCGMHAI